jgi:hypothetical protein
VRDYHVQDQRRSPAPSRRHVVVADRSEPWGRSNGGGRLPAVGCAGVGGVGKSTLTTALAVAAVQAGERVIALDRPAKPRHRRVSTLVRN